METPPTKDRVEDVLVSHRPWGRFEQLATNESATVKIITVDPGQRLSLQRHTHREELWQVLEGRAWTLVDGDERTLVAGDRVLIGVGAVHRLGNPGQVPVRVLEIAFGHFDEDDIERLEDDHSR